MAEPIISMAEPIFTYENIKNNQKIRDQWINYILQKSKDKRRQLLLTQFLGSNTLQINKLTPESFDTINKILGAPAINDKTDKPGKKSGMSDAEIDAFLNDELGGNTAGGAQGAKTGNAVAGGGVQGSNNGSDKKPRMSDAEIDAFLKEELGTTGWSSDKGLMRKDGNGTFASAGVPKGGTKTIGYGYDPNSSTDVTADVMKAVKADGNTSFANWRQSLINQGWNGDPSKIKYDPSTGKFMYNVNGQAVKSAGKPRRVRQGRNKTIGFDDPYDPNPGNVSLAYTMRNAPEQERRDALINEWNRENGRESVPYIPGTKIPAGSLTRSSSTYASPGISSGGTYATGEGIKDANGNVLTNPGGDWEYQYALKNPQYGLGMMSKMSDAQKNYLQAVSNDMGFNYNFTGAPRYV